MPEDEYQHGLAQQAALEEVAMSSELRSELEGAIRSDLSLEDIVALLRRYKADGVRRDEVYSLLNDLTGGGLGRGDRRSHS